MNIETKELIKKFSLPSKEECSGNENTFYTKGDGTYFVIAFDKIFEQPLIAEHNDFEMGAKRNFKNLSRLILETYFELFVREDGTFNEEFAIILFEMLNAKSDVMFKSQMAYTDFLKIIDKICYSADGLLLKRIDEYVKNNYVPTLDKITEETKLKNKKINTMLQFTDEHAEALFKISYLYRVMTPIISVYFTYNKSAFSKPVSEITDDPEAEDYEFDEINSTVFLHLFEMFSKNPEALKNKLYKLVHSRLLRTEYSDQRFWRAAKNLGITVETETLEIYKKLLTNVLPKLQLDDDVNVVSFFQSVVNNQIDFLFQNKFKYRIITLDGNDKAPTDDDEEDVSDFEKMEIKQVRFNEGTFLLRKYNNEEALKIIEKEFDVSIEKVEVHNLMNKIHRHSSQEIIVSIMTYKYFKDNKAIKFLDFYDYCRLVLMCKKFLEAHKYVYLPKILTANCMKYKERMALSGKKVKPDIMNSKKYQELCKEKYGFFDDVVITPFCSFIASTYSSEFIDDNGDPLFDSSVKIRKIADELFDLAATV